jgi:hypothetical protein
LSRKPTLEELIGADATGAERQRLQQVHQMLLEAGPPPEIPPELEAGPNLKMTTGKRGRGHIKQRAMVLLAAAILVFLVFIGGYVVANNSGGKSSKGRAPVVLSQALEGTALVPKAEGALEVWRSKDGSNWPMTLTVAGLPPLPPHRYYEVYLFRDGKIGGSCGSFRVGSSSTGPVTVTLTSPYELRKGDSWVVTRPGVGGTEPGSMVLRPVAA